MMQEYSIVIATYERADALRDALASVVRQTHPPARVVVVDSSSGDASEKVCAEFTLPIIYRRAVRPSAALDRSTWPHSAAVNDRKSKLSADLFRGISRG